jgi:hypothetical protein
MTYDQVVTRLEQIEQALADLLPNEYEDHPAAAYFRAKKAFEHAWAQRYIQTEGTVDERRNLTILKLYDSPAYKALVTAEASYEASKAIGRVLETRASIGQSLLRAMTREAGPQPQSGGVRGLPQGAKDRAA